MSPLSNENERDHETMRIILATLAATSIYALTNTDTPEFVNTSKKNTHKSQLISENVLRFLRNAEESLSASFTRCC